MFINRNYIEEMVVNINIMGRNKVLLFPRIERKLQDMGFRIKQARLRRKISVDMVAERAKVSRTSVWAVENGSQSVSIGIYAAVLMAVGLANDIDLIAKDDILGKTLQDLDLPIRKRAPKRRTDK